MGNWGKRVAELLFVWMVEKVSRQRRGRYVLLPWCLRDVDVTGMYRQRQLFVCFVVVKSWQYAVSRYFLFINSGLILFLVKKTSSFRT